MNLIAHACGPHLLYIALHHRGRMGWLPHQGARQGPTHSLNLRAASPGPATRSYGASGITSSLGEFAAGAVAPGSRLLPDPQRGGTPHRRAWPPECRWCDVRGSRTIVWMARWARPIGWHKGPKKPGPTDPDRWALCPCQPGPRFSFVLG